MTEGLSGHFVSDRCRLCRLFHYKVFRRIRMLSHSELAFAEWQKKSIFHLFDATSHVFFSSPPSCVWPRSALRVVNSGPRLRIQQPTPSGAITRSRAAGGGLAGLQPRHIYIGLGTSPTIRSATSVTSGRRLVVALYADFLGS